MLGALKDKASSAALKAAAKRYMQPYGVLHTLHIDSKAKRIEASVTLKGETEPTHIVFASYRLEKEAKGYGLYVGSVTVSKPWLEALAKRFVENKRWLLPDEIGKIATKII